MHPACKTCSYLPVCAGGCQWQGVETHGDWARHCEKPRIDRSIRLSLQRAYQELEETGTVNVNKLGLGKSSSC